MREEFLIGLTAIIALGIAAQWISWKFRLPSILLLLVTGFTAGPVTGFINPDEYFGPLLFPVVSVAVAIILFEGGLSLKISELKAVGRVVRNLISIGALITWVLTFAAAYFVLQLSLTLSVLLGAILVVTGPTVILPILRHVKPVGQVNSVLKWEGILNDPIGALLAILVFEYIVAAEGTTVTANIISGILKSILLSTSIGIAGGYLIMQMVKHHLVPDFLQNLITLAVVVVVFTGSDMLQHESGLFAVTAMGIFLANQKAIAVRHLIEFKENLRTLLISILFILLSARIRISDLMMLDFNAFIFVVLLLLVIRPAAVVFSSINSSLNWKEKLFLSWMAPRGVVAAAVSSLFAIELVNAGYPEAAYLVPVMFLVIVVTIAVYGLSAIPLAKWLGIANLNPQGCLIIGANELGIALGKILHQYGIKVLLIDTNYGNVAAARMENLPAHHGSILSENILDELELTGIGRILAVTPNKEVNSLAALYFAKLFGSNEVYQLSLSEEGNPAEKSVSTELHAQILFGSELSYTHLTEFLNENREIKATSITDKFTIKDFYKKYGKSAVPLFVINESKDLLIYTDENSITPKKGSTLLAIVEKEKS